MTNCVLIVELEIHHNSFGPSAQVGQLFGMFLKISSHHMLIVFAYIHSYSALWSLLLVLEKFFQNTKDPVYNFYRTLLMVRTLW